MYRNERHYGLDSDKDRPQKLRRMRRSRRHSLWQQLLVPLLLIVLLAIAAALWSLR